MADDKELRKELKKTFSDKKNELDDIVKKYIKQSERCGNTYDEKTYKSWLIKQVENTVSDINVGSEENKNYIENTLKNYAGQEHLEKYRNSVQKNKPRTPNNKDAVEVDEDTYKKFDKAYKNIRRDIRQKAKDLLDQSISSDKTPSREQYQEYLCKQMLDSIADYPQEEKDYIEAYCSKWIADNASNYYDESLKENPRPITDDFPWTRNSPDEKAKKKATQNEHVRNNLKESMTQYADKYNSFSGHDMVATFEIPFPNSSKSIVRVVGELTTLTYSVHDEKVPIRCLGDMNAKGYVFGPRTIAGTIVFSVFNTHWTKFIEKEYAKYKKHFLADEVPAFNITVSMANEYGSKAVLCLYGVTLVNEGQVMSIQDIYTENTYQFYALDIDYLTDVESKSNSSKKKKDEANKKPIKETEVTAKTQNVNPDGTVVSETGEEVNNETNEVKPKERTEAETDNSVWQIRPDAEEVIDKDSDGSWIIRQGPSLSGGSNLTQIVMKVPEYNMSDVGNESHEILEAKANWKDKTLAKAMEIMNQKGYTGELQVIPSEGNVIVVSTSAQGGE